MKILEKILFYGLILSLLTPLIIGEKLIFPFVTTKAYFFFTLVDILLVVYLMVLAKKPLYPHQSKLLYTFLGVTVLGFILDVFGLNFKNSFFGNYERMMSIFTSLHLLIYLWLLLSVFNTKEKFYRLLNYSLVVNFLVGVYAILQKQDIKFFGMAIIDDPRISATMGNPAYLASLCLIFLFLSVFMLVKNKHKIWRFFYIIVGLLNIIVLVLTTTRGAIFGGLVSIFVIFFYIILFYKQKRIRWLSAGLLVILVLSVVALFIFKDSSLIQNNYTLRRISAISLNDETTMSRLRLWKMAWQASQYRPVAGYGLNNIRIPLDKYHDYNLYESWFDSSHNKFFDELLTHGYLGFVLLIAWFVYLFIKVLQKRKEDFWGSLLIIALLVSYVVQAMFIFDSFIVAVVFTFILGWIINYLQTEDSVPIFSKKLKEFWIWVLSILILLSLVFIFVYEVIPGRGIITAYRHSVVNITQATEYYQQVDDRIFFNYDILAPAMSETLQELLTTSEQNYTDVQIKDYLELMTKVYQQAIENSSHYSKFYINLAKMYQLVSQLPRLDYIEQSFELLNQALEYAPNRIDIYYALAQGYFNQDNIALAEDSLQRALDLGGRQHVTYYNLAEVQARKGDAQQAIISLNKSEELGRELRFSELENFAKIFIAREEWPAVVTIFLKMHDFQPNNLDIYYNLALAYSQIGDKEKAREWIDNWVSLDPTRQEEAQNFINNLR